MSKEDMPMDPFGPEEDLVSGMKGMHKMHAAAQLAGFSPEDAMKFIVGIFTSMMTHQQGNQEKAE